MGVIHKLRDEIVSFILAAKKNNPSMGVRQLAVLTSEQFQIQVSKSSVSNLLKRSGMSSSIGRRPGVRGQKDKFSIPDEKKNQISKSMAKAGFVKKEIPVEDQKEEPSLPVDPIQEKEAVVLKATPSGQAQKEEVSPKEEKLSDTRIQEVLSQNKEQGTPLSEGAGLIFLKAAQWDIFRESLTAEVLKKYIHAPVSRRFDSVSDMFLFFKFLGVDSAEHIEAYRNHGLWAFHHLGGAFVHEEKDRAELQELFEWTKGIEESPSMASLSEDLGKIKEQTFFEVKAFRLLLEDRSEIAMDASMASFVGGRTVSFLPYRSAPMQNAIERLSNCLISNVCKAVFRKIPGDTAFDRAFYDMVAVFENIPGKRIIRASVIDEQDEEIAGFSTVPFQKRRFLMGMSPQQKEFENLAKDQIKVPLKKPFYNEGTGRTLYYSASETGFLNSFIYKNAPKVRMITLWEEGKKVPFWAILANDSDQKSEDILKEYIGQWPYFGETLEEDAILDFGTAGDRDSDYSSKMYGKSNIFSDFIRDLHKYCQKHFFPHDFSKKDLNSLITEFYSSSGRILESENSLIVTLDVPEGAIDGKGLEYAVQRVNERNIQDYLGRRLWLQK